MNNSSHGSFNRLTYHYFSRHRYTAQKSNFVRAKSTPSLLAWLWRFIFLFAPLSYCYIALVLLRELFGQHLVEFGHNYAPLLSQWTLASAIGRMTVAEEGCVDDDAVCSIHGVLAPTRTRRQWLWFWIELWCYLEALFYIWIRCRIRYIENFDPLEANLHSAPLLSEEERALLWQRICECEASNACGHISGWFFDQPCETVSAYDIREFMAWSMFEGRHQEHLTKSELQQMESFVEEIQYRISLELHGETDDLPDRCREDEPLWKGNLATPLKHFRFRAKTQSEKDATFFSNLFESYRHRYDEIQPVIRNTFPDFHPVQEFRNIVQKATKATSDNLSPVASIRTLMNDTAQNIAETDAVASASQRANKMYESLVSTSEMVEKELTATYEQLHQAWDSVMEQRRLETARVLSRKRRQVQQRLKGYRVMLERMRDMSHGVPPKQMASLMHRITQCHEELDFLETHAQKAFVQMTGFALKNMSVFQREEPQRFAQYSSDPIEGVATYPFCFHMMLLCATEIPLRLMLHRRGFTRCSVGPVAYYYHPGLGCNDDESGMAENEKIPVVFVHGIGIGLITYVPLIDGLLSSGRPVYLPEIESVSGFRPWQSSDAVLQPAVVTATMTAMLASHGHLRAAWLGHSYGTSWLSYLVKYAPEQFVYTRPDPGAISFILRTDLMVNYTIQRAFPWSRICLFVEDVKVPCGVVLSEHDTLVPSAQVQAYLQKEGALVQSFDVVRQRLISGLPLNVGGRERKESPPLECTIIAGDDHGDWTERPAESTAVMTALLEGLISRSVDVDTSQPQSPLAIRQEG